MTAQLVTPLPPPPSRRSPVNFNTRADAFNDALQRLVEEINLATPGDSAAGLAQYLGLGEDDKGAALVAFLAGTGAIKRSVLDRLRELPRSVMDHGANKTGASGTGTANVAAFQAALNASRIVTIPDGVFRLNASVLYSSGHRIRGAGCFNRGYYNGTYTAFDSGTVVIIEGAITAFTANALNTIGPEISGITFVVEGKTLGSSYGQPANYLAGTTAIDETGVKDGVFKNLQFYNVENCFLSRSPTGQGPQFTARNNHSGFVATDCRRICYTAPDNSGTTGGHADLHFSKINGAIHLNTAFELNDVDGFQLCDARIYQCYERQIYANGCEFFTAAGVTLFENGQGNAMFVNCSNVNVHVTASRAGWYTNTGASAIFLSNVDVAHISGLIEKPKGNGVYVADSNDVTVNATINEPGNGIGGASGVYAIGSDRVSVNGTMRVMNTASYAVNATDTCTEVSGDVSTDGMTAGSSFDVRVSGEWFGRGLKPASGTNVSAAGSLEIARKRIAVGAGKKLRMTYATWNFTNALKLRVAGTYFSPTATSGTDFTDTVIFDNSAGAATTYELIVYANNATAGTLATTAADEVSLKVKAV